MKPKLWVAIHFCLNGSICVFYKDSDKYEFGSYSYAFLLPKHAGGPDECRCTIGEWLDKQKEKC